MTKKKSTDNRTNGNGLEIKLEDKAENSKNIEKKKRTKSIEPRITKKVISVTISNISPDKYFVLHDGRTIKGIKELADIMDNINDEIFYYHVNDQKNDFSNWIRDVFNEITLAENIQDMRNKIDVQLEIYKHLMHDMHKKKK